MKEGVKILVETRKESNLSQEDFAKILFTTGRTIARWEKGENRPNGLVMIRLYELDELFSLAKEVIKQEKVYQWFSSPNPVLGGNTPFSILGTPWGIQKVKDLLGKIEWGIMP